jgi:tryptophanyl-tRNA synthetase
MDLQNPTSKMSKSLDSPQGTVLLLDTPKDIEKKFKRAVTDSEGVVRYAPDDPDKAGVSNLLSILGAVTGDDPAALATKYEQYGPLKTDTAAAVVEHLVPIQQRYAELSADPAELDRLVGEGAAKAQAIAAGVLARAERAVGVGAV